CTDGTARLLSALDRMGVIRAISNDRWRGAPQASAYRRAMRVIDAGDRIDWIMVLDADEMLALKTGKGDLNSFFDVAPAANLYSFNWRLFGHGGESHFRDALTAERFTRCGPPSPRQAQAGVKTLFRNIFPNAVVGPHRPRWGKIRAEGSAEWVGGNGLPVDDALIGSGWRNFSGGMSLGQVNHYAVRDNESFLMKMARGRGSNNRHGLHLRYWRRMSKNTHVDDSITLTSEARAHALSVLKAERRLRRLHKFAVETHRERIAAAHEDAELEAVYLGLCAENVRKPKGA
ncbi:MAG: glycosyltransferase family 2 protein, partial [Pikeienuella sp.]